MQSGAEAARLAHNQKVISASLISATIDILFLSNHRGVPTKHGGVFFLGTPLKKYFIYERF